MWEGAVLEWKEWRNKRRNTKRNINEDEERVCLEEKDEKTKELKSQLGLGPKRERKKKKRWGKRKEWIWASKPKRPRPTWPNYSVHPSPSPSSIYFGPFTAPGPCQPTLSNLFGHPMPPPHPKSIKSVDIAELSTCAWRAVFSFWTHGWVVHPHPTTVSIFMDTSVTISQTRLFIIFFFV